MEAPALASPRSTCLCAAASRAAEDFALFLRALRGTLHLVMLMGWRGFEEGRGREEGVPTFRERVGREREVVIVELLSSSDTLLNSYDLTIWSSHKNSGEFLARSSSSLAPVSLSLFFSPHNFSTHARAIRQLILGLPPLLCCLMSFPLPRAEMSSGDEQIWMREVGKKRLKLTLFFLLSSERAHPT